MWLTDQIWSTVKENTAGSAGKGICIDHDFYASNTFQTSRDRGN